MSTAHRCFQIRCHVFQQLCSKPPKNWRFFAAEMWRSRGCQLVPLLWALLSRSKCLQYYQIDTFQDFELAFLFLRSKIFMATHIMLSFSTQIAQHTEEHPPTPWRVGPCNQVTGAQGRGGGEGYLQQGVAAMPKCSKICRSSAWKHEIRKKGGFGFCIFINESTAKLQKGKDKKIVLGGWWRQPI